MEELTSEEYQSKAETWAPWKSKQPVAAVCPSSGAASAWQTDHGEADDAPSPAPRVLGKQAGPSLSVLPATRKNMDPRPGTQAHEPGRFPFFTYRTLGSEIYDPRCLSSATYFV